MRSRYSAYAKRLPAYLLRTWAPETRPTALELEPSLEWTGLEVIATTAGGSDDSRGVVEFAAHHVRGGVQGVLRERSAFRRDVGVWVYVDEQGAAHG